MGVHVSGIPPGPSEARDTFALATVVAIEAALLYVGLGSGSELLGVVAAMGGLYFLAAYRWPGLAAALAFLAAPFSFQAPLPGGAYLAFPTEPMMLLALAARATRALAGISSGFRRGPLLLPLVGYLGATLLSCFTSEHPLLSLKAWVVLAGYVVFGYTAFAGGRYDSVCRGRWVALVTAAAAAIGGYGLVRVALEGVTSRAGYGIGRPFFPEHGTYSAWLCMLAPLILLEALDRRGRARIAFASAFLLAFGGVILSFTRAAWVSLTIVLPATLILWAVRTGSWRRLAAPAAWATALVLVIIATGLGDRITRHALTAVDTENVSNLERVNRWMAGLEMARSHPWTGVGYDGFGASYAEYRRKTIVTEEAYVRMGVHSEPLRALSETGALGLAAGLVLVWSVGAAGIRSFWSATEPTRRRFVLGITAGLGTYFVHGLLNAYPGSDKVGLVVWMGIGAIASLSSSADAKPS